VSRLEGYHGPRAVDRALRGTRRGRALGVVITMTERDGLKKGKAVRDAESASLHLRRFPVLAEAAFGSFIRRVRSAADDKVRPPR